MCGDCAVPAVPGPGRAASPDTRFQGFRRQDRPVMMEEIVIGHPGKTVCRKGGAHREENTHETGGYSLDEKSIRVSYDEGVGSYAITGLEGKSENPFPFGTIAVGETRQGVVIFGIPEESHSFTLRLIDSHGDDVSNIIESGDIAPAPPG